MDEQFAPTPVMVYGVNLVLAGLAFLLLELSVVRADGPDSAVRQALGRDLKGRISPLIYLFGIIGSLLWVWLGYRGVRPGRGDLAGPRPTDGALYRRAHGVPTVI